MMEDDKDYPHESIGRNDDDEDEFLERLKQANKSEDEIL